jgi:hypothetical protein
MLTETEVWALVEGRCNKAEIAAACECDESVARALMIQAAMSRGVLGTPAASYFEPRSRSGCPVWRSSCVSIIEHSGEGDG